MCNRPSAYLDNLAHTLHIYSQIFPILTLMHSEGPKLHRVLAAMGAIGFIWACDTIIGYFTKLTAELLPLQLLIRLLY